MLKLGVPCRCLGEIATKAAGGGRCFTCCSSLNPTPHTTAAGRQTPARVMIQGEESPCQQRMGFEGYFWPGVGGRAAQNELVMPQLPLPSQPVASSCIPSSGLCLKTPDLGKERGQEGGKAPPRTNHRSPFPSGHIPPEQLDAAPSSTGKKKSK